ncbi:MAG: aromatic amino acid transaminase [Sphingomicrobium sp.]
MLSDTKARGLAVLPEVQADSLLALIGLIAADERSHKIDVGVGVFRDGAGRTPILKVTKDAEQRLLDSQDTKAYLGGRGDRRFAELIRPLLFGAVNDDRAIDGVQTPGGCGALRLGFQLLAQVNAQARVHIGTPTWPNHPPVIHGVGLETADYPYYEPGEGSVRFDSMIDALGKAAAGDVALLHGCCHNPTGADLDADQWAEVARVCAQRGLIPFIDIAYQGLGRGLEEDAGGLRAIVAACDEVIVAQSCDKNFSCYRDRVGSLWIKSAAPETTARAMAHTLQNSREMWSMPPDHGAATVRIILDDAGLRARWLDELAAIRDRINRVRGQIAAADPRLAFIGRQFGMFSMLPLSREQVLKLREQDAIYMADSGRFNVVGMADGDIERFTAAVIAALDS